MKLGMVGQGLGDSHVERAAHLQGVWSQMIMRGCSWTKPKVAVTAVPSWARSERVGQGWAGVRHWCVLRDQHRNIAFCLHWGWAHLAPGGSNYLPSSYDSARDNR